MERTIQKQVDVAGSWLTVDVYGASEGPTIVVIPGVMADAAAWSSVAHKLQGWATVAVVNRRGRFPSGPLASDYSLETEVLDAANVLRAFPGARTVFGWSYGGLIALHMANMVSIPHVIAYEPIMAPFGAAALGDLKDARNAGDLDRSVEVALARVTEMPKERIETLRSDAEVWSGLRSLSAPIYEETQALNDAVTPQEFGREATRIDFILGEKNRDRTPYGATFKDVIRRTDRAAIHELAGQAHLAHVEGPEQLAALVSGLGRIAP